jgi:hypothetical protein
MSAKLDDFGDVLTQSDLGKLMSWSLRTLRRLEKYERDCGIRCLPSPIPGVKHRYTKDAVRHWLKTGVPSIAGRSRKAA